ncbi:hypothetical protein [Bdellovibrio bacteriovorus]|uniref:hypothetical protein n=1 Tax=Bdellovibrio TaxID=958 RepID=UPI0035A9473B
MDSKRRYSHLIPSVLVATSLILSACQEGSHQVTPRVAAAGKGGAKTESIAGRTKLTKEQEGQLVDPTSLASYEQHLKPLFDKMSEEGPTSWATLFKLKRWVIGPMDLKQEESKSLSMTYAQSSAQALARQTQYEVWIDSRSMKDANDKEKADLLLNELLTGLYTLKNLSGEQLCVLVKEVSPKTNCAAPKEVPKEEPAKVENTNPRTSGATPAKNPNPNPRSSVAVAPKTTPLNQGDYANIRNVKNYISQVGANLSHEDLVKKMSESGFDVRIFELEIKADEGLGDTGVVKGEALESLFVQAKELNKSKATCHLLQLGTQANCEISVQRTVEQVPEAEARHLLKYTLKEEGAESAFLSETVYQLKEIAIGKYTDKETKEELRLVPLTGVALGNRVVGATFHMTYMVVIRTKDSLKLEGFLAIPGEVSKVTHDEKKNKDLCEGKLPEAKDKNSDMVLIAKDSKYAESIKAALKGIQVVPPCW